MLLSLRQLFRYRALIASLVARELTARYRGSVLGFFWSFVNPLLSLLIYTFVFTVVMPGIRPQTYEPFALFMFCGILPWTWFSSSLLEASNVLIAGGNLIRKVLFPAEVLPLVTVFSGLVHFCFGLPILAGFLIYYQVPVHPLDLLWFPVIVFVQLVLTAGLALLVSALTVHFRDVRDLLQNLLTLWFFATPIIYPLSVGAAAVPAAAEPESVHSPCRVVPGSAVHARPLHRVVARRGGGRHRPADVRRGVFRLRSAARYARRGSMKRQPAAQPAFESRSAALSRSLPAACCRLPACIV